MHGYRIGRRAVAWGRGASAGDKPALNGPYFRQSEDAQ